MAQIDIYYEGNLSTRAVFPDTGEEIFTDAPKDNQGEGKRFSPTDLVGVALGSCVLTLMGIMAKKLGVDISGTKASVSKEMAAAPVRRIASIAVVVTSPHRFSDEITEKLEKAGHFCPVHHSLHPDIAQSFTFKWGVS